MFMAKLRVMRSSSIKKKGISGIWKLKIVLKKIQNVLVLAFKSSSSYYTCDDDCEEGRDRRSVPEDVKAGHFAVIATNDDDDGDGERQKRFVVPLRCLKNPRFLRMLEKAAEEYGFDQDGVITIPCRPSELEILLAQQWQEEGDSESDDGISFKSCDKAIIKS